MVQGDWTIRGSSHSFPNDHPTGETDPCIEIVRSGSAASNTQVEITFPTSGTINGVNITGKATGQIESWLKFTDAKSSTNRRAGVCFYCSDTSTSSYDGYAVVLSYDSDGDDLIIYRVANGVATALETTALTSAISQNTWYHLRVTWTATGSTITIKGEVDFGSGYVAQNGVGHVDIAPLSSAGTDTLGHLVWRSTTTTSTTVRHDGFKFNS
jgi:hypothetical protein